MRYRVVDGTGETKAEGAASASEIASLLRDLPAGLRLVTEPEAVPGTERERDRFLDYLLAERERERERSKSPPGGGLTIVIPGLDKLVSALLGSPPPPDSKDGGGGFHGSSWP